MIMLGMHFTGKFLSAPFTCIPLCALPTGEVSKSKGTESIHRREPQYGTDAMRFTLAVTASVSDVIWTRTAFKVRGIS